MSDQRDEPRVRILIIDDEPAIGDALRLVLEAAGYEVLVVEKGLEGVRMAAIRNFRAAIIDLFLPDISGLQVIRTIRADQPGMPIILITGEGTPQAFSEARKLGVVGILAKPFGPKAIVEMIGNALAREAQLSPDPDCPADPGD